MTKFEAKRSAVNKKFQFLKHRSPLYAAIIADIKIPANGLFSMQNLYIPLSRVKFQADAAILQEFLYKLKRHAHAPNRMRKEKNSPFDLKRLKLNPDLVYDIQRLEKLADETLKSTD